jgi:hypothetical protein
VDGANRRRLPCKAARKFRCEHCRIRSSKSALSTIGVKAVSICVPTTKTRNLGDAVGSKDERAHTLAHQLRALACRFVPAVTASVSSAAQRPRPRSALDLGGAGRPRDVAVAPDKRLELWPARHSLAAQSHSAQNVTTVTHAERFSAEAYDEELRISTRACANAGWQYSGVDRQQRNAEQTPRSGGTGHGHHGRLWVCRWTVVVSHLH